MTLRCVSLKARSYQQIRLGQVDGTSSAAEIQDQIFDMQRGFKDPGAFAGGKFSDQRCLTECGSQSNGSDGREECATRHPQRRSSRLRFFPRHARLWIMPLSQVYQLGERVVLARVQSYFASGRKASSRSSPFSALECQTLSGDAGALCARPLTPPIEMARVRINVTLQAAAMHFFECQMWRRGLTTATHPATLSPR